jgi:hypothetical protein
MLNAKYEARLKDLHTAYERQFERMRTTHEQTLVAYESRLNEFEFKFDAWRAQMRAEYDQRQTALEAQVSCLQREVSQLKASALAVPRLASHDTSLSSPSLSIPSTSPIQQPTGVAANSPLITRVDTRIIEQAGLSRDIVASTSAVTLDQTPLTFSRTSSPAPSGDGNRKRLHADSDSEISSTSAHERKKPAKRRNGHDKRCFTIQVRSAHTFSVQCTDSL